MKYAMILCLMALAIGFNTKTVTATTPCVCPCLTALTGSSLTSSLTGLTTCLSLVPASDPLASGGKF